MARQTIDGYTPQWCSVTPFPILKEVRERYVLNTGGMSLGTKVFRTVSLLPLVRVRFGLALMLFHYKLLFTVLTARVSTDCFSPLYWVGVLPYSMTSRGQAGLSRFQAYEGEGF